MMWNVETRIGATLKKGVNKIRHFDKDTRLFMFSFTADKKNAEIIIDPDEAERIDDFPSTENLYKKVHGNTTNANDFHYVQVWDTTNNNYGQVFIPSEQMAKIRNRGFKLYLNNKSGNEGVVSYEIIYAVA